MITHYRPTVIRMVGPQSGGIDPHTGAEFPLYYVKQEDEEGEEIDYTTCRTRSAAIAELDRLAARYPRAEALID